MDSALIEGRPVVTAATAERRVIPISSSGTAHCIMSETMLLRVKVKPNSKRPRIERDPDGALTVYLKSPPVDGKANEELIQQIAELHQVPKSRVRIKSGLSSRNKTL